MRETITIDLDGEDVEVGIGAWDIRKGPPHWFYAPPSRWKGAHLGTNGDGPSVKLRIEFSIPYQKNNINYTVSYGGECEYQDGSPHWSQGFSVRRLDNADPTSAGNKEGYRLGVRLLDLVDVGHMDRIKSAAASDCLAECIKMREQWMGQIEKWGELRIKIEKFGMESER